MLIPKLLVLSLVYTMGQAVPTSKTTESPYLVVEDKMDVTESPYIVVEDEDITTESDQSYTDSTTCDEVMANNGLNFSSFWHGAAHGLHSLFLEEIREYFEPNASVNNKIPVVNRNLTSEQTILFNAPLAGYSHAFHTMSLKVMSYFMLNDSPAFYEHGVNTLEKITHQYHMHEIYKAASPIYKKLKENPPQDEELCPCVNDIIGNGIMTEMVNIAKKLKYFGSKRTPRRNGGFCSQTYQSYSRDYYNRCKRSADEPEEDIAKYEQGYLANPTHDTAKRLLNVRPWKVNTLVGPEQWISYQAMLTYSMLEEEELNDFAMFMYCKLNKPDQDGPKDLFE